MLPKALSCPGPLVHRAKNSAASNAIIEARGQLRLWCFLSRQNKDVVTPIACAWYKPPLSPLKLGRDRPGGCFGGLCNSQDILAQQIHGDRPKHQILQKEGHSFGHRRKSSGRRRPAFRPTTSVTPQPKTLPRTLRTAPLTRLSVDEK
jgi:hypothetical protein